jgi:MinD-like ATPase involved in chromosome partitioning or flagellar assembly
MLIFATSDKGGTGRSVTTCNVGFRRAMRGGDVCYVDFDFGSPTAGAILQISNVERGTSHGGLHSYLRGRTAEPQQVDIWLESERSSLRTRPPGAGRFVLVPGDIGGGEFPSNPEVVQRCAKLLLRLEEEFELCLVDLSAGRSHATEMVLAATALPELRPVVSRWLVFHRWTPQHITAAAALAYGERGIIEAGVARGHDRDSLIRALRFVRTVVMEPNSPELAGLRAAQVAWLQDCNQQLQRLARDRRIGRTVLLGTVPLDPVLQWHEQLITDNDVMERQIANQDTVDAFNTLADRLSDDEVWEGL